MEKQRKCNIYSPEIAYSQEFIDDEFDYDQTFMLAALSEAQLAAKKGEVPIGAVVVSSTGQILGQGHNKTEHKKCQVFHAEVCAIQDACKKLDDWRLTGCTLYVTLEPCMMCISLAALSRVERIVYGAQSPLFGFRLDKEGVLGLYTNHIKNITEGVLASEAAALLQDFFKRRRKQS
jgi:tRNA(adenine34) deaminase